MPVPDVFRTLAAPSAVRPPKTTCSRFLGEASPAATEAEAARRVGAVRQRERAATHVAWAWRLGGAARWSDDGEPSDSDGAPILREIEGRDLTDVVVTVTRYCGGTKLGVGGLARAYGEAAAAMRLLDLFDAEVAEQTYSPAGAEPALRVRRSQAGALAAAFVEATAGRGTVV